MTRVHRTTRRPHRAVTSYAAACTSALLILLGAACGGGGDGGGGPADGTPVRLELVGNVAPTTVNTNVTPAPTVKVSDAAGNGVAGVSVTFTANGGGSATGTTQVTDAQGRATVGSWRVGTLAGTGNTLVATAGSLTATISATASAGPATVHQPEAGQPVSQYVVPQSTVPVPPSVRVTDQYGNPVLGVVVTFTPGLNSGTVTGGVQTTNAAGVATVGSWNVGSLVGQQTLTATAAGGLPPAAFVANVGTGNPANCNPQPYTLLANFNGTLTASDCPLGDGTFVDVIQFTTASALNHQFRLASTEFDAFIWAYTAAGAAIGADDDESDASTNSSIRLIAPAGTYVLLLNSFNPFETGAYAFTSSNAPPTPGCSYDRYVVPGATWAESVSATDCEEQNGVGAATRGDEYGLVVAPGRTVTVTLRSSAMDAFLRIVRFDETGPVLQGENDNGAGGSDARLTFTAPAGADPTLYVLVTTTAVSGASGAYTVEVSAATSLLAGAPATSGPVFVRMPSLKSGARGAWGRPAVKR